MQLKVIQATIDYRLFGEDKCVKPKPGQTVEASDIGIMVRRVNRPFVIIPWSKVRELICEDYPPAPDRDEVPNDHVIFVPGKPEPKGPVNEPRRRGRPPKPK